MDDLALVFPRQGQKFVTKWMEENFKCISVPEKDAPNILAEFSKFKSRLDSGGGDTTFFG